MTAPPAIPKPNLRVRLQVAAGMVVVAVVLVVAVVQLNDGGPSTGRFEVTPVATDVNSCRAVGPALICGDVYCRLADDGVSWGCIGVNQQDGLSCVAPCNLDELLERPVGYCWGQGRRLICGDVSCKFADDPVSLGCTELSCPAPCNLEKLLEQRRSDE